MSVFKVKVTAFKARYPGFCSISGKPIEAGDLISYDNDAIVLVSELTKFNAPQAKPCEKCWTTPASNGACACED